MLAGVQYRWPHRNRRYFYVASSDSAAGNVQVGTVHHVTAFKIDSATGAHAAVSKVAQWHVDTCP